MKKFILPLLALILVACGGASSEETEETETDEARSDSTQVDTTVSIEDELVGAIEYFEDYAQFDTKTKLYEAFGEENIKDDEVWYAEGTVKFEMSVLTDPNNGNVIQFTWDKENNEDLSFIETWKKNWRDENSKEQRVESKSGLYTGMPLDELEEWNGGAILFSGFGWDYGGSIMNDQGGKLASTDVSIELNMLDEGYTDYTHLLGDMSFNSMDDEVQGAPIEVWSLSYYLD